MPKVSQAHRDAQRAEILDAARGCFAANGFHATSMQDILGAAGKSAGAVYRYFPGKSEIIAAIAEQNVTTLFDAVDEQLGADAAASVADLLCAAAREMRRRHAARGTASVAIQVWAEAAREPELRALFATVHERLRGRLRQLITARHPELAERADSTAGVAAGLLPALMLQLVLLEPSRSAEFEDGIRVVLGQL